ncbi:iron chelate uptake ABC transporter family permease subunit [Pseudomonas luteola]|uniref:iron chelate uptake ABC transporter family permease subunit n=1 Tax=Pseudomonas luteola TaxID=47886 RepID=UPI001EF656E6|nr:iron chelate uptake ABC transporter family permease subunit [Pseudomonas luteola]MCG7374605.1 iron chelate uptake ABC transporter family permease subunit [Pseudomonas luteola]
MSRPAASLIALIAVLLVVCLASLCIGTQWLSPVEAIQHVIAHDAQDFLVWRHRLPRTLIAVLAGGSFALAGALVQGVIRNPLASPEILGVTQGAGLALTIALIYFPALSLAWLPGVACLGGALGAGALALYSAGRSFSGVRFALSGVAISLTLGSVIEFLILSHPLNINTALLALTGSLWSRTWHHVGLAVPLLAGLPLALMLAKPLNLIGLGDEAASGLGVRLGPARLAVLVLAVILTSLGVAIIGPVSFIGLVAPHLARRLIGGRHQWLLPASAIVGAILLVLADTLGRGLIPPVEIPAGILTAIIGAPYFLWLLTRLKG